MVLADVSTAEVSTDEVKDLAPLGILADVKLRHELPTDPSARITLNSHVK